MTRHALPTAALALSLVALPLGLSGCDTAETTDSQPAPIELAEAVEYEVVLTMGQSGMTHKGVTLVNTVEQLNDLPGDLKVMLNPIMLQDHSLVVVSLGQQPTDGYTIDIDSVAELGDTLIVEYTPGQPGEDAVLTQVITTPAAVVQVSNTTATSATGLAK